MQQRAVADRRTEPLSSDVPSSLGRFSNDWLSARYHFSFSGYHDPSRLGIGPLLVWNDDTIAPKQGFDLHGHRDMEIITYVRKGAITHRDHLGNEGRTEAGDVQVMSAGRGIQHAEFNLESSETQLYQIWIAPRDKAVAPRWETRRFPQQDRNGTLVALASGRAADLETGALPIHQDAALLGATLAQGTDTSHLLGRSRQAYLVVSTGQLEVTDQAGQVVTLGARDGAGIGDSQTVGLRAVENSEILLADLPGGPSYR